MYSTESDSFKKESEFGISFYLCHININGKSNKSDMLVQYF